MKNGESKSRTNRELEEMSKGENIVLSQPVHETGTYRCDDNRGCIMQF